MGLKSQIISGGFDSPIFAQSQDLTQITKLIRSIGEFIIGDIDILIVMPEALVQKLPSKEFLTPLVLTKNSSLTQQEIVSILNQFGYKREEIINGERQYSLRGDVLDVFVVGDQTPTRIDFAFDTIEKIYTFNLDDMKKLEEIEKLNIFPATIFFRHSPEEIQTRIKQELNQTKLDKSENLQLAKTVGSVLLALEKDWNNPNLSFTIPYDDNLKYSLLDVCQAEYVFFDEPKKLVQMLDLFYSSFFASTLKMINEGLLLKSHQHFVFDKQKAFKTNAVKIAFQDINTQTTLFESQAVSSFDCSQTKKYLFDFKSLVNDLKVFLNGKQEIVLFAGDKNSAKNIEDFLIKNGIAVNQLGLEKSSTKAVTVLDEELYLGVHIWDTNLIFIATPALVKKSAKSQIFKKKSVFYLPKINDYVVHEFHGVGKCIAIEKLNLGSSTKEYFVVEYAGGDKIFVPSEQANMLSAYVGGEVSPKLNKIGGLEFAKIKQKAKASITELAINLIELYKKRETAKGFVFEQDSYLQEVFENAFEYEETPDQLQAINDIKNDMMSTKIMDRLICGDVGYGKTEVALRAIYKAVLSGKQVAFLCPTTILSEQHFKTCQKRFKDFMVRIGLLNRLVPAQKQKEYLKKLANGELDLIIGTHRLLAKDVVFKDLGLLVLDEEQRFGVEDKERIKELKQNIDVLTLSATPIPRTLHMSLSGIRDISIIETPPKNRLPVQTFACEYSDALLSDACQREISRGGQVYIVYNRVETIYDFANKVRNLLPNVSVGVAHGQMPSKMLEDAVLKLYNGEYQILVATTLIENGIDIPLANTLIVIDADRLGLSSLYQLKGRVGRSHRLAYAYFTYPENKVLTEDAIKRLEAITQYTELGSGFKIAMRDLEIRGAGTILGKKQHGHIEKVGYDLYSKMLDEAVKELKGEKKIELKDIKIDIDIDAYIPNDYISDQDERIKLYTSISMLSSKQEAEGLIEVYTQTYKYVPEEVLNLIKIALIKNICQFHDVKRVLINDKVCQIYLYKKEEILDDFFAKLLDKNKQDWVLKFDTLPIIELENKKLSAKEKCGKMLEFLLTQ